MKNQFSLFPWPPPLPERPKRRIPTPEEVASARAFIAEQEMYLREYIASLQPSLPFPEPPPAPVAARPTLTREDRDAWKEARRREKPYPFHFTVLGTGNCFFPGPLRVKMIPFTDDTLGDIHLVVEELKHYPITELVRAARHNARTHPPILKGHIIE